MQARRRHVALPVAGQVTSLELFFDLVFVFTITQLTSAVLPGGWAVTGRAALLLLLLWWMYGGYAWLTNAAPPVTPRRRVLLVLGMVGAVLGLVGALFFEDILVWWWLASFAVAVVLPRLVPVTGMRRPEDDGGPSFELVPGHFVERHGLMLLIALGESVLAIGVGLGTGVGSIGVDRIVFAAISLLLAATMYWAYFGVGEDARAEAALDGLPADRAQAAGLASYGYAFWVVLLGIVLSAAGLHHALVHPTDRLGWEFAGQLCVGVGLFWAGLGLFRLSLGLAGALPRLAGGVGLAAVIVVGAAVSGLLALVCLLVGSSALLMLERRASAA